MKVYHTFKQGVMNLSPVLSRLVKIQIHHIAGYHVISIKACDIKFRCSILNLHHRNSPM